MIIILTTYYYHVLNHKILPIEPCFLKKIVFNDDIHFIRHQSRISPVVFCVEFRSIQWFYTDNHI